MIGGSHGRILHIDLTTGQTHVEFPPDEQAEQLLRRGFDARLARRQVDVQNSAVATAYH